MLPSLEVNLDRLICRLWAFATRWGLKSLLKVNRFYDRRSNCKELTWASAIRPKRKVPRLSVENAGSWRRREMTRSFFFMATVKRLDQLDWNNCRFRRLSSHFLTCDIEEKGEISAWQNSGKFSDPGFVIDEIVRAQILWFPAMRNRSNFKKRFHFWSKKRVAGGF